MNQKQVVDLIKLIDRVYKTDYAGDSEIVKDWFKVLKNYEFDDITNSLDYYMKNYPEYAPKVYNLIKGYNTIEQKKLLLNAKTRCLFCGKEIDLNNKKHEDRCRSIEFIKSAVKRFENKEIDTNKYISMNDNEFNLYHTKAIKLIIEKSQNKIEVNMWKKYLESIK